MEIFCESRVSAYSSTTESGSSSEVSARNSTGWSAGLTFWNEGGVGMFWGSWAAAFEIADWTSSAAASRLRFRSNWSVMSEFPSAFCDVMLSRPAIVVNCFSSGVATAEAIVSGLAPGRDAVTRIVGKSTLGRSLTGSRRYPATPKTRSAAITSVVAIGRRMNGAAMFMAGYRPATGVRLTATSAPGTRRRCPSTTTCSPAARPR